MTAGEREGKQKQYVHEAWLSAKGKPWPFHEFLNLKLVNNKVMYSNWFQWELETVLHFKIDYVSSVEKNVTQN